MTGATEFINRAPKRCSHMWTFVGSNPAKCIHCGLRLSDYKPPQPQQLPQAGEIDLMIGRLDRLLSEFLLAARMPQDEPDRQTLKHHAEDLIGVGRAALEALGQ